MSPAVISPLSYVRSFDERPGKVRFWGQPISSNKTKLNFLSVRFKFLIIEIRHSENTGKIMNSKSNSWVSFFVNSVAAFYGLIGFFSIIPFLLFSFLFSLSFVEPSEIGRQAYLVLILVLGGIASLGILIIHFVYKFNDLGRKLMVADSIAVICLFLVLIWRGKIGSRVLTSGNILALSLLISLFFAVTCFLFHSKVKQFFTS